MDFLRLYSILYNIILYTHTHTLSYLSILVYHQSNTCYNRYDFSLIYAIYRTLFIRSNRGHYFCMILGVSFLFLLTICNRDQIW